MVEHIECHCLECNEVFYRRQKEIDKGAGKFCGRSCMGRWRRKRSLCGKKSSGIVHTTCKECGAEIIISKAHFDNGQGRYCSKEHMNKWKREHVDEDLRVVQSEKMKLRWQDPDDRAQMLESKRIVFQDPSFRERQSQIQLEVLSRPGMKEKYQAACNTPEALAKKSASMKIVQNDPDVISRRVAAYKITASDPEYKIRQSIAQKEAQNRPEVRDKRSKSLKKTLDEPDVNARLRERIRKDWQNDDLRERRIAAMKLAMSDPIYIESVSGENNGNWKGGLSYEPYGPEFNRDLKEHIRDKFYRKCCICQKTESDNIRKLDVHHINYNKRDNREQNLMALCKICHTTTNGNRWYWFNRLVNYWVYNSDTNFNI